MNATLTVLGSGTSMGVPTVGCTCAVCTSSAAPSMFRLRSNWMMMVLRPSDEVEVSEVMPAMVES